MEFIEKHYKAFLIVLSILLVLSQWSSCKQKKENKRLILGLDSLTTSFNGIKKEVNILKEKIVTREEFDLMLELEHLETSHDIVYNENTIVRTTKRPDDVMNDYNKRIKEVRKKLKELRE